MNKKRYLPLILFFIVVIAMFVQLLRNSAGEDPKLLESALVGQIVPKFNASDLYGKAHYNETLLIQGKPLLLNIWATWCPTCYAEHQYLNQLAQQHINIIGLNYKDDADKAKQWLRNLGNPYQVILADNKGAIGLDFGVYGAPETFVIGCNGVIHYRHAGDVNEKVWQQTLLPLYQKLAREKTCKN